eukprot:Sdes_comp20675_c0_seq2m16096
MDSFVNFEDFRFYVAAACIIFNPLAWNIAARKEYKTKFLTKLCGSPYKACLCLAFCIFTMGLVRDALFERAIATQPKANILQNSFVKLVALLLFLASSSLVLSSMYVLGITGTYLGDYCGILMENRVECFPFNILDNPMYVGSTLGFLSLALWYSSPAGILLCILVGIVYKIAVLFEGPFTTEIYRKRDLAKKKTKKI